jgi:hypothetical protein
VARVALGALELQLALGAQAVEVAADMTTASVRPERTKSTRQSRFSIDPSTASESQPSAWPTYKTDMS